MFLVSILKDKQVLDSSRKLLDLVGCFIVLVTLKPVKGLLKVPILEREKQV